MRRNDKAVKDIDVIKNIISKCQVVRVAMCKDDVPYLVPLNYGYEFKDGELILYCHCTNKGKKLDILDENPNVFIEIDNEKDEDLQIDKLYRAKDLQLDSDVYIKVIRDNTTIKDTFIANLVDESMMMSNIDCDNVANILDVITDESKYYIVSEYFNGISLFDLVF